MPTARRGLRVGAAAFALGVSLAGPQALGLAVADVGDTDGVAASQDSRDARGGAVREGRASGQVRPDRVAREAPDPPARRAADPPARAAAAVRPAAALAAQAREDEEPGLEPAPLERPEVPADPVDGADAGVGGDPVPIPAPEGDEPVAYVSTAVAGVGQFGTTAADVQQSIAGSIAGLNAAVAGFFDSVSRLLSSLPAGPLGDFLSGALLLVRRTLFDQAPTADPVQMISNSLGQIQGDLGARDPEGDPVTFEVVEAARFGTVEISEDGQYAYTPGPDFLGEDSFIVEVTDANGGFNLFNQTGSRSSYIEVRLPDLATPFDAGSTDEVVLSVYGVPVQLRIERTIVGYRGTVSLEIPGDTPLTWLDEDGRDGTVSALEVARNWSGIQDAGSVRLAIDFLNGDGVAQMAVFDSVTASYDGGRYVFTGDLAPAASDMAGIDSYYDVLGPVYKPRINAFRAEVLADPGPVYELSVADANLFLDTWSIGDWRQELAESDLGIPEDEILSLVGSPAASTTRIIPYDQLLNKDVGGPRALARLKGAIEHALRGGEPGWAGDTIFSDPGLRPPLCNGYGECNAYVYPFNVSKSDGGLYSILSKTLSLGSDGQSVDFSLDFGPAIYGYAAVPKGVVAMTDLSQYSLGFFASLVSGPSVTLKMGNGNGKFTLAERELFAAERYFPTIFGTFSIGGDLTAALDAEVKLQQGFTKDSLKASLYVKAGGLFLFNVDKFPTVGQDVPQFVFSSGYFLDPDYTDFKAVTDVVFSPTLTPSIKASWGLFTPKDTPVIKRTEAFSLTLGYSNPVSADLTFAANTSPSLTVGTKGDLTFTASVFKEIVDDGIAKIPGLGSVKGKTTYTFEKEIFSVTSKNLLTV